jgi:outer membrane protein TolC
MKCGVIAFAIAVLGQPSAQPLLAQTLTLQAALDRADQHAYPVRAARATAAAQRGQTTATLHALLPSLRIDAGLVRTTDPIGAFGNTLRQRTITQADFDPRRLNYPGVSGNWMAGLVVEQPLINPDAFAGRVAARRMEVAAQRTAEWASIETRVTVIRAFYGTTLAQAKVSTLGAAALAAREHVRQAELMARNGIVTPSDALLASVRSGEVETQLIEAQGEASTARLGLATILGTPADTAFTLPAMLPAIPAILAVADAALAAEPIARQDVVAADEMSAAASADRWRARALQLPRLNSFARYDWNSPTRAFGGDKNWTVGVMASWSVFAGATEVAERQATRGRATAADAMREGAEARADLERAQTQATLRVAIARLTIATRALQQSIDAHRIVGRRYDAGLASVVELLDAASVETQGRLALVGAQFGAVVAAAERLKALGHDPAVLRSLDRDTAVASSFDKP